MTIRRAGEATRIAETTAGPLLDVFIRRWLAGIFWASGMANLQSWSTTLYLATHEYPMTAAAAWLGEAIEIVGPPLLVLGLATRFAALPMLVLSLVVQFSYQALDQHLFWAILFLWYVVEGAGPISLDALIGRGIAVTAVPLAATITVSSRRCRTGGIRPSSCSCVAGSRLLFPLRRHEDQQFRHDADAL